MLTNAAFCGGLSGSAAFGPVTETPPLPTGPGGDSDQLLRSPSSSHRRVDIADRGRISGTQQVRELSKSNLAKANLVIILPQIPKPVYAGDTNSEKSRLECLEELEKELMLLGIIRYLTGNMAF